MTDPIALRLRHLSDVVELEIQHLLFTDHHLFSHPFSVERAASLASDNLMSERTDAFVSRFGRLQDTTGDKLLPALLNWSGHTPGPAIDNLQLAEKWGWIPSAQSWLNMRLLRNKMVHEYIKDPQILCDALNSAHELVPVLVASARQLVGETRKRLP